ncbi:hypothetical protein CMI37_09025 [Candidatus Pacearchaeota archaeon]|nr:hypothetical protein [Candidatus Pacearchaeota archaeon]
MSKDQYIVIRCGFNSPHNFHTHDTLEDASVEARRRSAESQEPVKYIVARLERVFITDVVLTTNTKEAEEQ